MQPEDQKKISGKLPTIIWKLSLYLFCYRVCFGIVLGVLSQILLRIVPKNSGIIILVFWIACYYVYSTKQVAKIVSKKNVIEQKDIIPASLGAAIALSVLQVMLSMLAYFNGGAVKFSTVLGIVLSNAIVFAALVYWFKKPIKA